MSEEGYPRPPILLQAVCPSAQSLLSILVSRIPALPSIPPRHFIVRHSDSADYKSFIQKLFVVIYEWDIPLIPLTIRKEAQGSQLDVNLLSSQVSVGNTSSQSEIVNRVISKFVNPQFLGKNLLSFGYRRSKSKSTRPGAAEFENYFPNTLVNYLRSANWEILHSRIGDEMMEYLLSKTSMFVALPNGCSFQLCGPPTTSKTIIRNVVPKSLWRRRKEIVSNKVKNIDDMSGSPGGTTDPHSEVDQTTSARARKRKSKRTRPGRRKKTTVQATTEAEWQESIQAVTLCVQGRKRQRDMSDDVDMPSKRMKTSTDVIHPTGCKRKQEIFHEFSSVKRVKTGEDAKCDDRNSENAASIRAVNPSVALRKVSQRTKAFPLSLILFHRRRTLYGDAQKNPKSGGLINGLPARSVLNARRLNPSDQDIIKIVAHIFPKQFGLPNIFDSVLNGTLSNSHGAEYFFPADQLMGGYLKLPWRLKNIVTSIRLMVQEHRKLNYKSLIGRNCPLQSNIISDHTPPQLHQPEPNQSGMQARSPNIIQKEGMSVTGNTTGIQISKPPKPKKKNRAFPITCHSSYYQVYRFVYSSVVNVVPSSMWGTKKNFDNFMKNVFRYLRLRKYESISLHETVQGLKIQDISWITGGKRDVSLSEATKQKEIFYEWCYWVMNHYVIPLVRTNFYVTDATPYRNRIFYYRQDVWMKLRKPVVKSFVKKLFKKMDKETAISIIANRSLGFSTVRLLPKESGLRLIINLSKKTQIKVKNIPKIDESTPAGRFKSLFRPRILSEAGTPFAFSTTGTESKFTYKINKKIAVNATLQNSFQALKFEALHGLRPLKGSVLGVNEVYGKFKMFKQLVLQEMTTSQSIRLPPIYFVKMDVKSCFDSIKHEKLLDVVKNVLKQDEYLMQRFSALTLSAGRIQKRFMRRAIGSGEFPQFPCFAQDLSRRSKNTIFVDNVVHKYESSKDILNLVSEHVTGNIIKLDNEYYQQVEGIAQGSVISCLLCSFYYEDMESVKLKFIEANDTVLAHFVDDFILMTMDRLTAVKFVNVMSKGHPEYGCLINHDKTIANFEIRVGGLDVPMMTQDFPWCGLLIDTTSLEVRSDMTRYCGTYIDITLTVTTSKEPLRALRNKFMQFLKSKCIGLLFDLDINSEHIVMLNIYQMFCLCAMKCHVYVKELSKRGVHVEEPYLLDAIFDTVKFGRHMVLNRLNVTGSCEETAVKTISQGDFRWLAITAFRTVFKKKQTRYPFILHQLYLICQQICIPPHRLPSLQAVIDDTRNDVMEMILY